MVRPPIPPFDTETARQKVRIAEDAWNSRDPARVAPAYTDDSRWRNRNEFITGHSQIIAFLTRKWAHEHDYRRIKDLWAATDARIACGWHDDKGGWSRSYGNENWRFASDGRMCRRIASINDLSINESERLFRWPLGRRPDDHPGLTDLDL